MKAFDDSRALSERRAESEAAKPVPCWHEAIVNVGWAAILVYLVAVPATNVWVDASGHDFARVVEVALGLVCAIGLALGGVGHPPIGRSASMATGLLALALASTFLASASRGMAERELTLVLGLVGIAVLVARRTASDTGITVLLATISIAGAFYAALTLLGLGANLTVANTLRPYNLALGYDNGRFFNHVQTVMLPLLAVASLHPFGHRALNCFAAFAFAMGLALLAVTEGRATTVALFVGAVAATGLFPHTARPLAARVIFAGACATAIYIVCFIALPRLYGAPIEVLHVDGVADTGSAHSRFILWRIALDGIRTSPWLGIGPMHFSHTWNSDAAHPHNVYLQVAEEWGVPMLLLLLGIAFFALRRLYRAVRDHRGADADRRFGLVLFMTLIAIAVDGCLSGNFVMPVSQVWIAVVAGAAIGWVRRTSPPAPAAPATRFATLVGRGLRWVPLAAMLWLTASVAPELGTHFLDRPGPPGTSRDAGAPRFWSNGWF